MREDGQPDLIRSGLQGSVTPVYRYLGDRWTRPELKGARCAAVRRADGKCIRARNGSMLVRFDDGTVHVVVGRLLRKERA
jgi:hypothetical protein